MLREGFMRLRVPLLFLVLVVAALITMAADQRSQDGELSWWSGTLLDLSIPIQKMVSVPTDGIRNLWSGYVNLVDLRKENEGLLDEVHSLRQENLQLREALIASGRLGRVARMRDQLPMPMLPAEIVGRDLSRWYRSVLLDRGRQVGVAAGMPVVSDEGVVGLVTAVSDQASKIMLLLDGQSAIDGTIQRSRAHGIVRGRGGEELLFEYVIRDNDVRIGDLIISSGVSAAFPKGLRIGEVVEVLPGDGLVRTARLKPAVDFGRLEQVFILLWRGPTMDLLYEEPSAVIHSNKRSEP